MVDLLIQYLAFLHDQVRILLRQPILMLTERGFVRQRSHGVITAGINQLLIPRILPEWHFGGLRIFQHVIIVGNDELLLVEAPIPRLAGVGGLLGVLARLVELVVGVLAGAYTADEQGVSVLPLV